jgi:hypothetical protein
MSSREAIEPRAPLVKAGAREKYAEVYTRVGLPLAVVLQAAPPAGLSSAEISDLALSKRAAEEKYAEQLHAIVLTTTINPRKKEAFYAKPEQKRGSVDRLAPFTPFVLLHRLGDYLTGTGYEEPGLSEANRRQIELRNIAYKWERRAGFNMDTSPMISRGVDTAAGRMGVLSEDYLSDLWAKWLLTGRVAYSPTEPPPESPEEARFRNKVAEYAPQIFRIWYDYLDRNRPMVINV